MSCLRQGLEGRVMDVVGMSWGRNRMEAKKKGSPWSCGVSEGKLRSFLLVYFSFLMAQEVAVLLLP